MSTVQYSTERKRTATLAYQLLPFTARLYANFVRMQAAIIPFPEREAGRQSTGAACASQMNGANN
jgi:hypothetical protein